MGNDDNNGNSICFDGIATVQQHHPKLKDKESSLLTNRSTRTVFLSRALHMRVSKYTRMTL